ncbi:F-box/kelch-repeat protein At3g23880-like [Rosa rugosa]|uniref:F-box/kelch-repeat protein At3g23880-like n=1 Tax=Rosa rugosa TaxID=74645 RepID=UPI002B40661D|nr:F-box/kelch-repeat protein At3g23880-like [Rosa rugosa]
MEGVDLTLPNSLKRRTPFIHQEIIRDILSRLPVKSLKRFECVCKPWQALITSINLNRPRLLYAPLSVNPNPLLSVDYEALNNEDGVAMKEVHCPAVVEPDTTLIFLGSCHGLVGLGMDGRDGLVLWNPSTGDMRVLPKPTLRKDDMNFHGVGYDPSTEDYKVICGYSDHLKTVIEVYSLKRNAWRTYIDLKCVNLNLQDLQGCYLNGSIHWIKFSFLRSSIISFDLAENRFKEALPLPDCGPGGSHELSSLGIGTTRNCLFVHSGLDKPNLNIWVMKEFGVRESWTRVLHIPSAVIGPDHGFDEHGLKPLCILDNGEFLMAYDEKCLQLYNPSTMTFRRIIQEDDDNSPIETVTYEETLVSLPVAEVLELE